MTSPDDRAALTDDFRGDDAQLISCIKALLEMDADGVLRPHGVGGHARGMLSAAAVRLASQPQPVNRADGDAVPVATISRDGSMYHTQWHREMPELFKLDVYAEPIVKPEHSAIYISKRLTGSDADAAFVQAHINQAVSEAMEATPPASTSADAQRYYKLRKWMSSNVDEGWRTVTRLAAVACYVDWENFDRYLDDLPECNVGLCAVAAPIASALPAKAKATPKHVPCEFCPQHNMCASLNRCVREQAAPALPAQASAPSRDNIIAEVKHWLMITSVKYACSDPIDWDEISKNMLTVLEYALPLQSKDAERYRKCRSQAVQRHLFEKPEEYDAMVDESIERMEVRFRTGHNYGKKVGKDGSLYTPTDAAPALPAQDKGAK